MKNVIFDNVSRAMTKWNEMVYDINSFWSIWSIFRLVSIGYKYLSIDKFLKGMKLWICWFCAQWNYIYYMNNFFLAFDCCIIIF